MVVFKSSLLGQEQQVLLTCCSFILSRNYTRRPFTVWVCSISSCITSNEVNGIPENDLLTSLLLVEFLSDGNCRHDEVVKAIMLYRLEAARYTIAAEWSLEADDEISSPLLSGFTCRQMCLASGAECVFGDFY